MTDTPEAEGRVLGLDPGERRIGVAVSDPHRLIATPHSVIDRHAESVTTRLEQLCEEFDVRLVVVGSPRSLTGENGSAERAASEFADWVASVTRLPVEMWDERFTSVIADDAMIRAGVRRSKRRQSRDKVAAAVILQSFLDSRR